MKIIGADIRIKHLYDNGVHTARIEETKHYHYDSKEELKKHEKKMIKDGFNQAGSRKCNLGTTSNPNYVWANTYYRYKYIVL